jgi:hypothetical protein
MKRKLIILITCLCVTCFLRVEAQDYYTVPSPNAGSLGLYGEIPVSLNSGIPQIGVPLFELKGKNITANIGLSYHASGVRPEVMPSWVGQGWTLNTGGSITRIVKGTPDETNASNLSQMGYYFNYSSINKGDWNSQTFLKGSVNMTKDTEPDEFSFNFLGISGKFFLSENGEWKVACDRNLKVEFNGRFISSPVENSNYVQGGGNTSSTFEMFVITDELGNRYTFGGSDAIEYSDQIAPYSTPGLLFNAVTWNLIRIENAAKTEVIDYIYERGPYVAQLNNFISLSDKDAKGGGFLSTGCSGFSYFPGVTGNIISPVYLKSISFPLKDEEILFDLSLSNSLRYTKSQYLNVLGNHEDAISYLVDILSTVDTDWVSRFSDKYEKLRWLKLDGIRFTCKSTGRIAKQVRFPYDESPSKRLFLNGISILDENQVQQGSYSFLYKDKDLLPPLLSTVTDHWGFNNNVAYPSLSYVNFDLQREVNEGASQYGILSKITYPTGGSSEFVFENNRCGAVVKDDRSGLLNQNSTVGGLRVKEIISSDGLGGTSKKRYLYCKGYTPSSNVESLQSSGVLLAKPKYRYAVNGITVSGKSFTYYYTNSSSVIPLTCSSTGQHIAYSEVAEVNQDGSYSIYKYSDYTTSKDEYPDGAYNVAYIPSIPYNERSQERGLLIEEGQYDKSGNVKRTVTTNYTKVNPVSFVKVLYKNRIPVCGNGGDYGYIAVAYTIPYCTMLRGAVTEKIWSSPTSNISKTTFFTYNDRKQVVTETKSSSDGSKEKNLYVYPNDVWGRLRPGVNRGSLDGDPNLSAFTTMEQLNMVGIPIETIRYKQGADFEKAIGARLNLYRLENGVPVPSEIRSFASAGGLTAYKPMCFVVDGNSTSYRMVADDRMKTDVRYTRYDGKCNLLETEGRDGVRTSYLWDNKGNNIIAVANNMSYDALMGIAGTVPNTTNEVSMLAYLQGLRSKLSTSPAFLSTYTYHPLVGLTSATNPQGITTLFRYDPMGRLSHVLEKDKVVANYYYSYYNQAATEKYFSNAAVTRTFTKSCSSGDIGSSVTYTVPAGRYTSMISQTDADAQAQAEININGQDYANANGTCLYLTPASSTTNFAIAGGAQSLTVNSNASWSTSTSGSWFTVTPSSASGNATLSITCSANAGGPRIGTVTLQSTPSYGSITKVITVNQNGSSYLTTSEQQIDFDWQSGSFEVMVSSSPSWSITSTLGAFITATKVDEQTLKIGCGRNIGSQYRYGSVTISNGTKSIKIEVTQATNPDFYPQI